MSENDQERPSEPKHVRAFIAVELPEGVKRLLEDVETRLKRQVAISLGPRSAAEALKWVNPEGLHITLKFLGYVAVDRIESIEEALRQATVDNRAFKLHVDGLGAFPNMNRPRVLWVGVTGDLVHLASLQSQVDRGMAGLGFAVEKRPFSPHLTLARLRETASVGEARAIGQVIRESSGAPVEGRAIVVDGVSLMRSELSRHGAHYSRLAHFKLSA